MSAANRRRGADAERAVVNWLRTNGYPDARRYLAGDGRQPGDIDAIPGVSIEVKDRARSAWPEWQEQALTEARGRIPIVVRRTRGTPDVGLWRARVPWTAITDDLPPARPWLVGHECRRTGLLWIDVQFGLLINALTDPEWTGAQITLTEGDA